MDTTDEISAELLPLTSEELEKRQIEIQKALDDEAELEAREQLRQSAISKLVAGQPLTTAEAELLVIR